MGKLMRRVLEGYEPVAEWDADDPDSLAAAQSRLEEEVEAGYSAVSGDGGRNEPVQEIAPDAKLVILTMPMGGG